MGVLLRIVMLTHYLDSKVHCLPLIRLPYFPVYALIQQHRRNICQKEHWCSSAAITDSRMGWTLCHEKLSSRWPQRWRVSLHDEDVVVHEEMTDEAIISNVCKAADAEDHRTDPWDILDAFNTIHSVLRRAQWRRRGNGPLFAVWRQSCQVAARQGLTKYFGNKVLFCKPFHCLFCLILAPIKFPWELNFSRSPVTSLLRV